MPVLHILTKSKHSEVSQVLGAVLAPYQGQIQYRLRHPDENLSDIMEGDVVLAMGSQVYTMLKNWGAVPKNKGIKSMRSRDIQFQGISIIATYDPWQGTKDHMACVDIRIDCALALRRLTTGTIKPEVGNYRWVDRFDDVLTYVEKHWAETGKACAVSMDLECVGLDEINPNAWIVSISLTYAEGQADAIYFSGHSDQPHPDHKDLRGYVWKQLQWLFTTKKVKTVGANLKFDMRWVMKKWGIWVDNFAFDTTLVGSLLDENRSNSLNNHAKLFTTMGGYDDDFNDTADKSRMDLEYLKDPQQFLKYAGGDTDACFRIRMELLKELLPQNGLTRFYAELLHPASKVFTQIECEGVNVDVDRYRELETLLKARIKELHDFAIACISGRVKAKHSKVVKGVETGLKLTRDVIIRDHLFSPLGLNLQPLEFTDKTKDLPPEKRQATVGKLHLKKFEDHPQAGEFIKAFQEYVATKKTLDTYVTGFLKHLRADNKFHCSYLLFKGAYDGANSSSDDAGTNTGRLSAKDPAMQTIPKHTRWAKPLRKCFRPPEGHLMFELDYKAGELRVIAVVANEQTMIKNFQEGKDPHVLGGAGISKMTYDEVWAMKETDPGMYNTIRKRGKPANFGLSYGMQAEGYHSYARDNYGVQMTLEEAYEQRADFFQTFTGLIPWHEAYQEFARKNLYVPTPLGRIRHLPFANHSDWGLKAQSERQAINAPIQATLSDLTQLSAVEFEKEYGMYGSASNPIRICMMVHDALIGYVPIDLAQIWLPKLKEVMENLPLGEKFGWYPQVKFEVDAEVHHDSLADLMDIDEYFAQAA
jgi:DNA polymerase I-like protein with 3'-5' exonuclease and polymerase domains